MFSTSPDLVQYIEDQTSQGVSFLEAANSAVEKGLV
jgi:hypothetical protein